MYCEVPSRSDALLADVRGITDDEDAFLAPFTEPGPTDRPPAKAPAPSPEKVRTHLAGRMGEENYAAWYAEALLFIAARPGWWPGTAPAASRKERPLPHVRIRPDDNLTRTKG